MGTCAFCVRIYSALGMLGILLRPFMNSLVSPHHPYMEQHSPRLQPLHVVPPFCEPHDPVVVATPVAVGALVLMLITGSPVVSAGGVVPVPVQAPEVQPSPQCTGDAPHHP